MDTFCDHLFRLRDQALDEAMRSREELTLVLDESEDPKFARAMEHVAHAQPYARWWMAVTDEIEHGGLEAMAALTKVRAAARQALLLPHPTPGDSWFNVAHSHAATEAARRFYRDTALFNLDTITGSESAAPAITGTVAPVWSAYRAKIGGQAPPFG
jgi:hypothetical protein